VKKSRSKRPVATFDWKKFAIVVAVVAALFCIWRFTPLADEITAEHMSALARKVGRSPWSPFVLALAYVPANFVMFPRPLLTLFAVVAYGPWLGFATSMSGIVLAASAAYYAGRAMPEKTIRGFAGDKLARTRTAMRKHGLAASFAFSVVPIAPAPVIGMVAGAARLTPWQFLLGTVLGMFPGVLATTLFADQLAKLLDDAEDINWWIVGGVVVVFAAMILLVRAWIRRRILPSLSSS
jgi:uncharacterized membrane protein YdjX (TVP38/TMEM64 family)